MEDTSSSRKKQKLNDDNDGIASLDEVKLVEDEVAEEVIAALNEVEVVEVMVEVEMAEHKIAALYEEEKVEVEVEVAEDEEEEESVSSNSLVSYSTENTEYYDDTVEMIVHKIDDYVNTNGSYPPAVTMLRGLPVPVLDHCIRIMGRTYQQHCGFHHLVNSCELFEYLEYGDPIAGYIFCKRVEDDDRQELLRWSAWESMMDSK